MSALGRVGDDTFGIFLEGGYPPFFIYIPVALLRLLRQQFSHLCFTGGTMPRMGISEDQVKQAIAVIEERGDMATFRAIRAEIGHGSYKTIQDHLRAIRSSTPDQNALREPPPAELRQRVEELGDAAWKAATALATAEIAGIKAMYHGRLESVDSQLSEALEAIETLEGDLEAREIELGEARKQLVTLVDTVKRHEVLLAEATRRETEATQRFEAYVAQLGRGFESLSKAIGTGAKRTSGTTKDKTRRT